MVSKKRTIQKLAKEDKIVSQLMNEIDYDNSEDEFDRILSYAAYQSQRSTEAWTIVILIFTLAVLFIALVTYLVTVFSDEIWIRAALIVVSAIVCGATIYKFFGILKERF